MTDYQEYKKQRLHGYRAMTAKRIADQDRGPSEDPIDFTKGLDIMHDAFLVRVRFEVDEGAGSTLSDDYGYFSDSNKGYPFAISHRPGDRHTYDWFIPVNLPSVAELSKTGLSKAEAYNTILRYARDNYRRVVEYGEHWIYMAMHIEICLSAPGFENIVLADSWVGSIPDDTTNYSWVYEVIDEEIDDMENAVGDRLRKMYTSLPAWSSTVSGWSNDKKVYIKNMCDALEEFGAMFLIMYRKEVIDGTIIREWVDASTDEDEMSDLRVSLADVRANADDIAAYIRHN